MDGLCKRLLSDCNHSVVYEIPAFPTYHVRKDDHDDSCSEECPELSLALADLDDRINAKESFSERVGVLPFAAGALAALVMLILAKLISGLS